MGKKGDATKQHIRTVAFQLFAEFGYTRVTMQDICTKSGLSKGGLYRHYEDKFQIFSDVLLALQAGEAQRETDDMAQGIPAAEALNGFLQHVRQDLNKAVPNINIALYEFCVENKNGIGAELLAAQLQRGTGILLSLIEYGVSRGEFHVSSAKGVVSTILFLVEGLRMANEVMELPENVVTDIFTQIKEMVGIADARQVE